MNKRNRGGRGEGKGARPPAGPSRALQQYHRKRTAHRERERERAAAMLKADLVAFATHSTRPQKSHTLMFLSRSCSPPPILHQYFSHFAAPRLLAAVTFPPPFDPDNFPLPRVTVSSLFQPNRRHLSQKKNEQEPKLNSRSAMGLEVMQRF